MSKGQLFNKLDDFVKSPAGVTPVPDQVRDDTKTGKRTFYETIKTKTPKHLLEL